MHFSLLWAEKFTQLLSVFFLKFKKPDSISESKTIEDLRDQLSYKSKQYDVLQADMENCKQGITRLKDQNKHLQDKLNKVNALIVLLCAQMSQICSKLTSHKCFQMPPKSFIYTVPIMPGLCSLLDNIFFKLSINDCTIREFRCKSKWLFYLKI